MSILNVPVAEWPINAWTTQKYIEIFREPAPRAWHVRDALRATREFLTVVAIRRWIERRPKKLRPASGTLTEREIVAAVKSLKRTMPIVLGRDRQTGARTYQMLPAYLMLAA